MEHPKDVVEHILNIAREQGADFAEAVVWKDEFSLKRIRDGEVDQPPAGEQWGIDVALVRGRHKKTVSFDNPNVAADLLKKALETISYSPEQDIVVPTDVFPAVPSSPSAYDETTAELKGERSIEIAKQVDDVLRKDGVYLSGKVAQGRGEVAYGNTIGTFQSSRFTLATAAFFGFDQTNPHISSYANSGGVSINDINADQLAQELQRKCVLQRDKKRVDVFEGVPEGEALTFDVVIEPYVVDSIFSWLGFFGFNGLFVERGESFISGKIGQPVVGSNITIKDDPFDKRSGGMSTPFDFEGRPRQPLSLIEHGVAKHAVYDTQLAMQWKNQPTGNALPPSARSEGAAPYDLVVEGGDSSVEQMVANSKKPTLWITKVHYLGMKHYQTATMTGIAQHGVFLVEDGKVVSPIENVRFEESISEALKRVEELSPSRLIFAPMSIGLPSGVVAPAMKIKDFRFTGSTKRTL